MSTVFLGLSGGVDSAVSAAILKEQGHSVVGAFIKIWRPEFTECPWREDRLDAMRVAAFLGIPFREIDLSDEYRQHVIDDMVTQYGRGITPNPDVLCNRHIKFGAFARWAYENGADAVATGHYARNRGALMRGTDTDKDQSYFLWQLTREDLARVIFPVGAMRKSEVREKARALGLPVATKKDSQGLCFVGDVTMREFLGQFIALRRGAVTDASGAIIGEHDGAALYTLGERHGLRIFSRSAHERAHYVIAVDTAANIVSVSADATDACRDTVQLLDVNWLLQPQAGVTYTAQARYREMPIACTVENNRVTFAKSCLAPPGQSLVVYDKDVVIGGGIIAP